eukprot:14295291-Alexandrium_andersonii.AAC.1
MCIRDRYDDAGGAGTVIWLRSGGTWDKAATAATRVDGCPSALAAEARAAALAIELLLHAAIPGPRETIAGDCRPVVNYAAGCGRLRNAAQHHALDAALARLVVHGW